MNNINTPLINTTAYIGEHTLKEIIKERQEIEKLWQKPHPKKRILFAGTYPINQSNGYSKVSYYTAKHLAKYDDIELTIYGFQNFKQTHGWQSRNDIPSNVKLHDALATENPRRSGFGEKEIGKFLKENPQDVIIIFNDSIITSAITATIINEMSNLRNNGFMAWSNGACSLKAKSEPPLFTQFCNSLSSFSEKVFLSAAEFSVAKSNGNAVITTRTLA